MTITEGHERGMDFNDDRRYGVFSSVFENVTLCYEVEPGSVPGIYGLLDITHSELLTNLYST